tara:strand:- start:252 stop:452 length:201 start_codon:yes stop_codon:yes gene_type:complete
MSPSKTRPNPNGGADRDRTDDLLNANQALFQLSYGPAFGVYKSQSVRLNKMEAKNTVVAFLKNYFV